MKDPAKHIAVLRRRLERLKQRIKTSPNTYDMAERGALEWALLNVEHLALHLAHEKAK